MYICQFCHKLCKNKNSLVQHEIRCKENPDRLAPKEKSEKWKQSMKSKRAGTARNQYTKAKELGLPKPEMSIETRKKLAEKARIQNSTMWTEEFKKKHSDSMLKAVSKYPDSYSKNNVCGRVKAIEYKGRRLKGTWEHKTAMWLDNQGIRWETEANPQPYFWNNKWHMYFPDFWLVDLGIYIEVKGYKTERDQAKWSQFPFTLCIIDSKNIDNLENLTIYDLPR